MPVFDTPEPISATVQLDLGAVRITAGHRTETLVEVRPSDELREADIRAAGRTLVEYSDGRLLIKGPKQRSLFGRGGSVDIAIELPAGSQVHGSAAMAEFRCTGPLGDCRLKTSYGDIELDRAGALQLDTGYGDITTDHSVGHAEVATGSGGIRIREIDGTAVIKNSNGDSEIGEVTGGLRLNAANGDISVDRAHSDVTVRTAHGDVRIGEVTRGSVLLESAYGELEVGIRRGTAAWLDVRSDYGALHNRLGAFDGPTESDETVEVRARTGYGDILIRHS
ncbi:DUF4097 family beta strand repeat-containing protein [Kitasatospora sp. HPMI-4]|uniref:DUF4097 family beta strand repeat-containing protein n=1 Tax=Kitasatospora sp. HPMI-4 TaxID=3448443 RepID=UPI003F1A0B3E